MKTRRATKRRCGSSALDHAGNPYGGGSMFLTLRDFIKLGQLMLGRGTWQGRRIVSEDFAARAASPLYNLRNIYYSYQWWGQKYPYKDRTVYAFSARGAGGQKVREPDDDRNAPVIQREYVSPYGASKDGIRVTKRPR